MNKALLVGCVFAVVGCGTDIGQCISPVDAARTDSRYQLRADAQADGIITLDDYIWPGQAVINSSCAGGRCHSVLAKGKQREGAPAGLDFDVPMSITIASNLAEWQAGHANVVEYADSMWKQIQDGLMPPNNLIPDTEAARNWLACGAPARQPDIDNSQVPTFDTVWATLSNNGCLSCHNDAAATASGGGFSLGSGTDECTAYNKLVGQPSNAGGLCAGGTYVVRQDPNASLLMQKLSANPSCGSKMPLGTLSSFQESSSAAYTLIQQWIAADAPKPAICP